MIFTLNLPQRTVLALSIVLSMIVGLTLIFALWQWRSDWVLAHSQTETMPSLAKTDASADIIAALPSEHLFGNAFSKDGDMPITSLQLLVTGIVSIQSSNNETLSKAYISIAGQPGKIYQAGDTLPDGVKIYDILPHAVILENNGRLEKLPLPRTKLEFKPRNEESV